MRGVESAVRQDWAEAAKCFERAAAHGIKTGKLLLSLTTEK